jgi:SAM-dependent methyltransferase
VGTAPLLAPLKALLKERTEGNPLFIEESVRTLAESGALVGERGAFRLAQDPGTSTYSRSPPEYQCFWNHGISYIYDDLRDMPIRNDHYDTVVCLSTLEHVGCDNTQFTADETHREHRRDDYLRVMGEFRRVLRPGGALFLTVPFGQYEWWGEFQQFDRELLSRAIEAFGPAPEPDVTFYRYSSHGWQIADEESCADCHYGLWALTVKGIPYSWEELIAADENFPAAARAVACVKLVKA